MSTKRVVPTGVGTNQWTGTFSDVDETINNVSTADSVTANNENDVIVLTFPDGEIISTDYVWMIESRVWARTTGSGNDNLDILTNGQSGSQIPPDATYRCHTDVPPQNRDLGTGQQTVWNNLTVQATAAQSGMNVAVGHEFAACEVLVQYFKASPSVGELAWMGMGNPAAVATFNCIFGGSTHTAKSGNILVVLVGCNNGSGVTVNTPTGYTAIGGEIATNQQWQAFYKVSDGTEGSVTVTTTGGNFDNGFIHLLEFEWGLGVDSVQFAEVTTEINNATGSTVTSASVTATNETSNLTLHAFGAGEVADVKSGNNIDDDAWNYYGMPPSITNGGTGFAWASKANASGAQSVTFTDTTDAGSELYAMSIVFNEASGGGTTVATGLITENETLFSPTVIFNQTVTTGLITENETLFSPTAVLTFNQAIVTGLITENETLFSAAPVVPAGLNQQRVSSMHFQKYWEPTPMAYE